MTVVVRTRPLLPDLFDWADQFPPFFAARSMLNPHLIRVEDKIEDGHYVVRAELPGIDPDKDVKITVDDPGHRRRTDREADRQVPLGIPIRRLSAGDDAARGGQGRRHQGQLRRRHPDRRNRPW